MYASATLTLHTRLGKYTDRAADYHEAVIAAGGLDSSESLPDSD
ncbi:hypothetical protein [Streptomyces sp. NPDC093149]